MRNDRGSTQIALISLMIAIIAIIVDATTPEIREFFGLEKPDSYAQNNPAYTNIKSEVGAEEKLKELEQLLKKGDFKAADQKTGKIMFYVANREKEGWIDSDSMQKFSCTDLRTIDQLWVNNSNGRFGFSVQKRIFEENGKDWGKWFDAVGWTSGGKWKKYTELTFAQSAERGHLPGWGFGGVEGFVVKGWAWGKDVFLRVDACNPHSADGS